MISLHWATILILSVVFCGLGSVWFGPLFGRLWMKIHGFENKSKEEMAAAMQGIWKLILSEFIALFIMIMTLDFMITLIPSFSGAHTGFMVWLGFVFPTYITAIIWGADAKKWMLTKIALSASYRLVVLLASGYFLTMWK